MTKKLRTKMLVEGIQLPLSRRSLLQPDLPSKQRQLKKKTITVMTKTSWRTRRQV